MIDLGRLLAALGRGWRLLALVTALVLGASLAAALLRPARYATGMRLLVTRDPQAPGLAGLSDQLEDTTAQDLPAIVQSAAFRADLAAELAARGQPLDPADLAGMLAANFSEHTVSVSVQSPAPELPGATATALIDLLRRNGLHYWGDPAASAERPGLLVGVLDPPGPAARVGGPRALALELALRSLLGLGLAAALVLARERLRSLDKAK